MSTTLQSENISDSKPAGRPIFYRVTATVTLAQIWPFLVLAVLYLVAQIALWLQHRQPITFDPLSICFAIAVPLRLFEYFLNRGRRLRYQQAITEDETLFEIALSPGSRRKAQILSGLLILGLLCLLVFLLRMIATSPRPIPAFCWFYPPFLLIEAGTMLVTAREERVRILTTGIVHEDRLFQTFFPWSGIKELIWFSDTQKLRIECHDTPDWRYIRLGRLTDSDRDRLFAQIKQQVSLQRQ